MNLKRQTAMVVVAIALMFSSLAVNIYADIPAGDLEKIQQAVPDTAPAKPAKNRKLLILTKCNGYVHSSIPYCSKALAIMGEKTGAYSTVVTDQVSDLRAENLKNFDAVCFNNTTRLNLEQPGLRKSLLQFVRSGKGVIGIHAATDCFYEWQDGAELMGGLFAGHPWGASGTWAIKIADPDHAVTAAFGGEGFKVNDEIYRIKPVNLYENCHVVMTLDMSDEATANAKGVKPSDAHNPISWVRTYGDGRVFYSSLGHNHHIFWNPKILRHYLAGIQFAMGDLEAETRPSGEQVRQAEEILEQIAEYDYGDSRKPLTDLEELLRNAYGNSRVLGQIEKHMIDFLRSDASFAAKQFICEKLSVMGTEESAGVLEKMLVDEETTNIARYALERIPGPRVDAALRESLGETEGQIKVGIINTIGMRRDERAVDALARMVYSDNSQVAEAAASALGKIANSAATEALAGAKAKTSGQLHTIVVDAYLACADKLAETGGKSKAMRIYREVFKADESTSIRAAALTGMINSAGDDAVDIIVRVLRTEDQPLQAVALDMVRDVATERIVPAVTKEMPRLGAKSKVQLLSALADRGDERGLLAALETMDNADEDVRIAALRALQNLGNASTIMILAEKAASTRGPEQQAARHSLSRLSGQDINPVILKNIKTADAEVKIELIGSIENRRIPSAVDELLEATRDDNQQVRLAAIGVLGVMAKPQDLAEVVDVMIDAKPGTELQQAGTTVAAVAAKIENPDNRADVILEKLQGVEEIVTKAQMLEILGQLGDEGALDVLYDALQSSNDQITSAAIRSLTQWPTAKPIDELYKVAQGADNKVHRILALRGFVQLLGYPSDRPVGQTVDMYEEAMELAPNANEKRNILSGLANVKGLKALQLAGRYINEESLQQEAAAAVINIAGSTIEDYPKETKTALRQAVRVVKTGSLRHKGQELLDRN